MLFLFNKLRRDERPLLPRSLVSLCLCILIIIEKYADGRNGRFKGTTFRKISLAEEVPLIILHNFVECFPIMRIAQFFDDEKPATFYYEWSVLFYCYIGFLSKWLFFFVFEKPFLVHLSARINLALFLVRLQIKNLRQIKRKTMSQFILSRKVRETWFLGHK